MFKVFTKIKSVEKEWGKIKTPIFLNINFLKIYYQKHRNIKHLFIINTDIRLYAHIFKLTLNKTKNYLDHKLLANILLRFVSLKVLYLTNSYITNIPAFINNKKIELTQLLNTIKERYSIIIIPDFLFENMIVEDNNYMKIEAEEEMIIDIKKEWKELNDYILDLKKKYRNKILHIIKKTDNLKIKKLNSEKLTLYKKEIQELFNQIARRSRFKGPDFNTNSFIEFTQQGFMKVDGYFLNNNLIGFSSTIEQEEVLYSYFVGFDKKLNRLTPIYGRILIENISSAIRLEKKRLILGRTANEYKSNFGATPIKSFIYLKVKNRFLRVILKPIYSKLRIDKWIQRSPFKKKITHN